MLASRKVLLAGIESAYGRDVEPATSADEVQVEKLDIQPEGLVMLDRPIIQANLGNKKPIYAGQLAKVTCECEIKGSGSVGVAPEIGKLLRGCAFAETVVGGTSVTYLPSSDSDNHESLTLAFYHDGMVHRVNGARGNASFNFDRGAKPMASFEFVGHIWQEGTAQTGGASSITLATTASATDDFYNNMRIAIIQGTGAGQENTITDYVGATKIATVSAWSTNPDSTSKYAILTAPVDATLPTPSYDSTVPAPFIGMDFKINSYAAIINALSVDMGNTLDYAANVNAVDGYGQIRIVKRNPTGNMDPEKVLRATHDFFNELRQGTAMALQTGQLGATAGNLLNVTAPAVTFTNIGEGDRNSISTLDLSCMFAESAGDDEISFAFT